MALGLIPLGFILAAIICLGIRRSLRYFSPQGLQAVAQCRSFNSYLHSLQRNNSIKNSAMQQKQDIFTRYLPYATSFGWGNSWIRKFQQLGITSLPHGSWASINLQPII
ncbi:DUF2207 family protein [Dictyobacter formicarum]|uniref:Predicted membrane protein YciQ-like C-terminal domain-containing protein n=1 Tax=Dictyobacter formicarum TaxID=2778368 RepID=A0ABQ3VM95_9CHLR|nr:DUF2207 domain-containing protein [Dictyobacter formicarum]GHO87220.1 hypothetical protein KSZ_52260 [Dictyobacter formicarum]